MTADAEHGKILLHKRELPHAKHIPAYAVAASPAYIVLLALREAFGEVPEMIFSGINRGANAGAAVVHSGTVGATLTGSYAGLHGLAVSLDVLSPRASSARSGGAALAALDHEEDEKRHWESAAELAVRLKYAGVPTERLHVEPDLDRALDDAVAGGEGPLFAVPTYTAMLELRERLVDRGAATSSWA